MIDNGIAGDLVYPALQLAQIAQAAQVDQPNGLKLSVGDEFLPVY